MKEKILAVSLMLMCVGSIYSDNTQPSSPSSSQSGSTKTPDSITVLPMDSYKHRPKSLTSPSEADAELVYDKGYVYFRFLEDFGYAEATVSGMDRDYEYVYTFATSLQQPEYVGELHGTYQVIVETQGGDLFGCVLSLE